MTRKTLANMLLVATMATAGVAYSAEAGKAEGDSAVGTVCVAPGGVVISCELPDTVGTVRPARGLSRLSEDNARLRAKLARFRTALSTPCRQEDSTVCFWEAHERGNGHGKSFVTVGQRYYYLRGGVR